MKASDVNLDVVMPLHAPAFEISLGLGGVVRSAQPGAPPDRRRSRAEEIGRE